MYNNIHPDEILVHTGAEEGIFTFMNAMLQPGDHIIVHYPCYQSLFEIANSIGCEVTKWVAREEDNWDLDIEFVKDHLQPETKVIVINCPHNPTGYLMPKEKWSEIDNFSKEHGLIIFSDEVYRFLEYREEDRLPALCDINDRGVSLGVMSKTFGLAGLRIGWIATTNQEIYNRLASFKDYVTICNSAPSELLATIALRNKGQITNRNNKRILKNLNLLNDFFTKFKNLFN